jgi:hypothetical protein
VLRADVLGERVAESPYWSVAMQHRLICAALIALSSACGTSPDEVPDTGVADGGSPDASSPDAASPGADAGDCECERGTAMEVETCDTGCEPLACRPGWGCVYPFGASVDYTLGGSEGVGSSGQASVQRTFSKSHAPDDSDGATCYRYVEEGRTTLQVSATDGTVEDGLLDRLYVELVDLTAASPAEVTPAGASRVEVAVVIPEGPELVRVDTATSGQCTVTVAADLLTGELHCTGLAGRAGPTSADLEPAPGTYTVDGTWSCVTLLGH